MINITPGGSYDTQRRGVISGGSISMRNKVVHPNVVSWVPPDLKGGCGGIDLFAGSFSYINGAQFTQLSRSIAQAAVGYAFELAIEGMCPTCAQVVSKLQSEVAKINSLMRNSCELAKTAVNATGLQAWRDEQVHKHSQVNTGYGFVDDYFNAKESGVAPAKTTIINGKADDITGNVVMQSINAANAANWYAHGDNQLKMVLMSLTGTAITNKKDDQSDVKYDYRPPILKLKDFMDGGNVEIYKCEPEECLLPDGNNKETIALTGLRALSRKMIFGTCVANLCTGGILNRMTNRSGTTRYVADEQKFIESTIPGVAGMLRRVSTEKQSASLVAEKMVDVVSVEIAASMINEMFISVDTAVKATGQALDTQMQANMRASLDQIKEERHISEGSVAGMNALLNLQEMVQKTLRTPAFHKKQ
jgi:conjugative transfer pilus assembly protein TraH